MTAAPQRQRRWLRSWRRAWALLLAGCLMIVGATEAVLLEFSATYFTGGFNGLYIDSGALIAGFLLSGGALDLWLTLGLWAVLIPLLRLLRTSELQTLCLSGLAAVALPISLDIGRYRLYATLGDMASVSQLWGLASGSSSEMAAQASGHLAVLQAMFVFGVLAVLVALFGARRVERRISDAELRFAAPSARSLWAGFAATGIAGAMLLLATSPAAIRVKYGVARKPATRVLAAVVRNVTDVDRDGYGLLSRPADSAPFDASIHPYAVDVAGNGVDENGLAGDHPRGFEGSQPIALAVPGPRRPHFLLIFLESFRADLLGASLAGVPITPVLDRLAEEGTASERAYVHSPRTVASRGQLFGGRLIPYAGQRSLIDDFKALGYHVAHFSGQDDSFVDSEALLGVERADHFYDARQDLALRTSVSTSSGSLQISWKLLVKRVSDYLATQDPNTPMFLYVNIVDTHFPYHHDQLDRVLDVDPVGTRGIRADRRDEVWATYANTAANVDRGVGEVLRSFRDFVGVRDHAILVTADHGQAFYERGFLGHGQSVVEEQTRVPFILWGVGGDWPEPLGLADVRGLLSRNLFSEGDEGRPEARFVPDPQRRILQYTTAPERPTMIGLRGLEETVYLAFADGRPRMLDADDQRVEVPESVLLPAFEALVWSWEQMILDQPEAILSPSASR